MMVAGFGFKVAAVPFHGWIPDVYEGAPTPVTAFLSVASKAAGFAVVMRVFFTAFEPLEVDWALLFAGIAAASMTFGNLAAIQQANIKRMLAYSTIAHAGYLLVGLAAVASRTPDGVTIGPETVLFYLAGYAVTNLAAFFAVIAVADRTGSELIASFAGMGRRAPWLAAAMSVALLSLTGIPLTVGFMAKLFVFGAAVKADLAWLVALGAVNSVVSAYYYLRVVRVMYLGEPADGGQPADEQPASAVPLDLSVAVTALAVVRPRPLAATPLPRRGARRRAAVLAGCGPSISPKRTGERNPAHPACRIMERSIPRPESEEHAHGRPRRRHLQPVGGRGRARGRGPRGRASRRLRPVGVLRPAA